MFHNCILTHFGPKKPPLVKEEEKEIWGEGIPVLGLPVVHITHHKSNIT
jgi:hypothetical protein